MKIAWKFVLTSTIILVIAMLVVAIISTNRFSKAVTDFAQDDLQRTAEENADYIARSYDDKTRLSEAIAGDDQIIQSCIDQANGLRGNQGDPVSPPYVNYAIVASPARYTELSVYLNRNWTSYSDQLENLFVGDIYGYAHCGAFEVMGIGTSGIPMNVEGRGGNYWKRCIEGSVAFGDLEGSPVPDHDFLASAIATPVKDATGRVCGLVGVAIDFRPIETYVEKNAVGETGHTIVLDRYGRILVHPDPEVCLQGVPEAGTFKETYLKDLDGSGWEDLQEDMIAGKSDYATVNDGEKEYRVYYAPVPVTDRYTGMGLSVAALISEAELHEKANENRNIMLIFALIAVLVAIAVSYIVASMIVRPVKSLQNAADKISKGDMNVAIDVKSKDEVGDLARSFERMVTAVRFLSEDQEKGGK